MARALGANRRLRRGNSRSSAHASVLPLTGCRRNGQPPIQPLQRTVSSPDPSQPPADGTTLITVTDAKNGSSPPGPWPPSSTPTTPTSTARPPNPSLHAPQQSTSTLAPTSKY